MNPTRSHHPRPRPATAAAIHAAAVGLLGACLCACNAERKAECDAFVAAMKPLDDGIPTADAVDRVQKQVEGLKLTDQALGVYAKNYTKTLTILAGTLRLKDTPEAPDGTNDVIKANLKEARTDKADAVRYCAQ